MGILIPISACGSGGQQAPKQPSADEQIRAVIHQSIDAWNRGDADAFASTYCAKKRERRVDELTAAGVSPLEEVTIGQVTINGDEAEAEVTLTHKDRDADIETFPMVYEGGRWKMCD